jgi:hypothetical protein
MVTNLRRKGTAAIAALALTFTLVAPAAAQAPNPAPFNVLPVLITSVTVANGQLVANGIVGSTPFQSPITLTPGAVPRGGTCPILNLSLGPIHLSLLGLNVDTSRICLRITAIQGGGLLGDLLCGIANLLNSGIPLADVLAGLTAQQLNILNSGLTQVLNQAVFIPLSRSDALRSASCSILHLELGPLDLNLLGLRVQLNNCANGPVVLDITATPAGGLLGQLLCSLAGLLPGGPLSQILGILQQISALLGALVA